MKRLLSIKRWRKAARSKKPVLLPRTGLFKEGETYPIFVWDGPINKNDPAFIRAQEETRKILTECPIPEWVLNRTQKPQ